MVTSALKFKNRFRKWWNNKIDALNWDWSFWGTLFEEETYKMSRSWQVELEVQRSKDVRWERGCSPEAPAHLELWLPPTFASISELCSFYPHWALHFQPFPLPFPFVCIELSSSPNYPRTLPVTCGPNLKTSVSTFETCVTWCLQLLTLFMVPSFLAPTLLMGSMTMLFPVLLTSLDTTSLVCHLTIGDPIFHPPYSSLPIMKHSSQEISPTPTLLTTTNILMIPSLQFLSRARILAMLPLGCFKASRVTGSSVGGGCVKGGCALSLSPCFYLWPWKRQWPCPTVPPPHCFFPKGKATNFIGQLLKHSLGPILRMDEVTILWRQNGASPTWLSFSNSEISFLPSLAFPGKVLLGRTWAWGATSQPPPSGLLS